MLQDSPAFSGFSVNDLAAAKEFYGSTLGLSVEETEMGLEIQLGSGGKLFVYSKEDHQPATFTILNFPVDNIDSTVSDLKSKGVNFEHYPQMTGDDGIARGRANNQGPDIAWFKDPAGNILSVLH